MSLESIAKQYRSRAEIADPEPKAKAKAKPKAKVEEPPAEEPTE